MSTSDTPRQYRDVAGNPVSLRWLVANEPEWAANQILHRDKLERELNEARDEQMSALALVALIREALGDNGKRMQDKLIAYCRELAEARKDSERLDWLCEDSGFEHDNGKIQLVVPYSVIPEGKCLGVKTPGWKAAVRAAIDAAREGGR